MEGMIRSREPRSLEGSAVDLVGDCLFTVLLWRCFFFFFPRKNLGLVFACAKLGQVIDVACLLFDKSDLVGLEILS